MELSKTLRGFSIIKFKDQYDNGCSLQKSSVMSPDCIWLGVDDANPQIMASKTAEGGTGWVPFAIPSDVNLTTRMHLTQKQVKELLPHLKRFARTGELS